MKDKGMKSLSDKECTSNDEKRESNFCKDRPRERIKDGDVLGERFLYGGLPLLNM